MIWVINNTANRYKAASGQPGILKLSPQMEGGTSPEWAGPSDEKTGTPEEGVPVLSMEAYFLLRGASFFGGSLVF
jgi:hypothetical protein